MVQNFSADDRFLSIKRKRLSKIANVVAFALTFTLVQVLVQKNYSAAGLILTCQVLLIYFAKMIEYKGIYNIGSLVMSLVLSTLAFWRCLQGGGLEASSVVWLFGIVGSGCVFLDRNKLIILVAYVLSLCSLLFIIDKGYLPNPVPVVDEPDVIWLFDYFCNFALLVGLFVLNNNIYDEQRELIKGQENALLLQSRVKSMGEMAAGIAHEVNNPLTIIVGKVEIIEGQLERDDFNKEQALGNLQEVKETSFRIREIVRSLKKLSSKTLDDDLEELMIKDIYKEIENLTHNQLQANEIQIYFELEDDEIKVLANYTLLGQILLNLITNSQHAIVDNEKKWIRVSGAYKGDTIEISVTDSGQGISPEVEENIFDPFFTTKGVGEGTGLGLSLCKTAVEQMGGKLWINHNSPNTQFVVSLNVVKPPAMSAAS